MSTEQNRFPIKAEEHRDWMTNEHAMAVCLDKEDYEALAACWHSVHGENAIRVNAESADSIYGKWYRVLSWRVPNNATIILDSK